MSCTTENALADESIHWQRRFIGMFSYGSNNEQQLRARVNSPNLRGRPAFLDGYVRVFGANSRSWGGGIASVTPKEGGRVYGRFYVMTAQEVEILDMYEGVKHGAYAKEAVMVNVCLGGERGDGVDGATGHASSDTQSPSSVVPSAAITYVMSPSWISNFVPPSQQYLTAVYRTLTSSFPRFLDQSVEVCDSTGRKVSEWRHPGVRALPLEAFLLEVGLREEPPWTFPTVLEPLVARLAAAGVTSTDALCEAATNGVLLSKLAEAARDEAHPKWATTAAARGPNQPERLDLGETPIATGNGKERQTAEWLEAEVRKQLVSLATVPEFTEKTVGIIARIVSEKRG